MKKEEFILQIIFIKDLYRLIFKFPDEKMEESI